MIENMTNLLILGAGQYGMVAKEIAESMGTFSDIAFLDDNNPIAIGKLNEYAYFINEYDSAVIALGDAKMRLELLTELENCGFEIPVLMHKNAYVSPSAIIGKGSIIEPMAVIHTDVKIGAGCIISAGTIVNHNAVVSDGCHLNCGTIVGARANVNVMTKSDYGQIIN